MYTDWHHLETEYLEQVEQSRQEAIRQARSGAMKSQTCPGCGTTETVPVDQPFTVVHWGPSDGGPDVCDDCVTPRYDFFQTEGQYLTCGLLILVPVIAFVTWAVATWARASGYVL